MSAASEAFFETVTPALDDIVACTTPLNESPSWAALCSGQVVRITTFRCRPNGTVWIEGEPVDVEGFNNPPRRVPSVIELRRRCAVAIARAEGLKDDLLRREAASALAPVIGSLSAAQLDGTACAYCHRPAAEGGAMVPLKVIGGERAGAFHTLFVCDPDCRPAEPTPKPAAAEWPLSAFLGNGGGR